MEHYDVIIIGTGAGGGNARAPARALGQADPAARARRLPAARARELGQPRGLQPQPLPLRRDVDRQGRRRVRTPPAVLRRRQHEVLRRDPVPAARARLRRRPPLRRHVPGLAAVLRGPRALLHRGRAALSRPRAARRGSDGAVAVGRVPVPGGLARAAHPAAPRRLRAHRPPPVPPAGRRRPGRVRSRGRALRALRPLRRVPVPCRRQGRRPRAVRAAGTEAAERQAAHARARRSASRPARTAARSPRSSSIARATRSATAPMWSSSRAAR